MSLLYNFTKSHDTRESEVIKSLKHFNDFNDDFEMKKNERSQNYIFLVDVCEGEQVAECYSHRDWTMHCSRGTRYFFLE